MIGQAKLLDYFNNKSLKDVSHSNILCGDYGCGKHTLVNELARKYCCNIYTLDSSINYETLNSYEDLSEIYFLVIDKQLSIKDQNKILKFIEDQKVNVYIWILIDNINSILPTILSRCIIYNFEDYSRDALESFIDKVDDDYLDFYLGICNTPGKVIKYSIEFVKEIDKIAIKLIDNIKTANISNLLFISDKYNLKKDKLFIDMLIRIMEKRLLLLLSTATRSLSAFEISCIIKNLHILLSRINVSGVDYSIIFDDFIIKTRIGLDELNKV